MTQVDKKLFEYNSLQLVSSKMGGSELNGIYVQSVNI